MASFISLHGLSFAGEATPTRTGEGNSTAWQEMAAEYARMMALGKCTPVSDGTPMGGEYFEEGTECTETPYSSVKYVGRYIGFDIFLNTFLAAVPNLHSVLYTESFCGEVKNVECYFGKI